MAAGIPIYIVYVYSIGISYQLIETKRKAYVTKEIYMPHKGVIIMTLSYLSIQWPASSDRW